VNALASYRQLLRNGPLTRLLVGEFVSDIGNWLYLVALLVVVYQASRSPFVIGVVGAARILPYVVLSVPAGVIADRFDRRLVLMTSDLVRAVCMLVLTWLAATNGPAWAIVAVAILATCFATLFYPAIGALLPSLAANETEFGPANSAWSTLSNLAFVVGPAIGGLLIAAGGLPLAFMINAVSFGAVAVVLWSIPPSRPERRSARRADTTATEEGKNGADAADGGGASATVAASTATAPGTVTPGRAMPLRPVAGVMVVDLVNAFASNGLFVMTVVLATTVYQAGDAATGYLNAAIGVGGVVGAAASGVLVLRPRLLPPLVLGAVTFGVSAIGLGLAPVLLAGVVAIGVASAASLVVEVTYTTIFQRVVPDHLRGRATGVRISVSMLFAALGSLLMPALGGIVGPAPVLAGVGVMLAVGGLGGAGLIGAAGTRQPTAFERHLVRVKGLAVFAGLPPARLEAALSSLQPVAMTPGVAIIRQGEPADRFYIVAEGTVAVTQTDPAGGPDRLLRHLGVDDVFGEIGLLTSAPRTATVTAESDGLLLALDGRTFLDLVAAGPGVASRLLDLYQGPTAAPLLAPGEAG
jgi:MFS family permease